MSVEEPTEKPNKKETIIKELWSWAKAIIFAIIIATTINNFVIVNATVPSGSMEPSIQINDRVVAFRFSYLFSDPRRFDIIVFNAPHSQVLYIKRIIGLPGETIRIHAGFVYVNGVRLVEDTFPDELIIGDFGPFYVGEEQFFVLGDHRNNSSDSRSWANPFVSRSDIVGRAVFKYFRNFEIFERSPQ
ncbi:MAG: signal peptidase I [Defluviitaleaceae bacterium]|nr:signal peptidase I [Defluviitaleaceae bacterium]